MKFDLPVELVDVSVPNNKVLILPLEAELKSKGGLIIDHRHIDKFKKGVVVLVGPGKLTKDKSKTIPMSLEELDIVLFDTTQYKEVSINCKTFYIFDESVGIIAKIGKVANGEVELYVDTKL